METMKNIKAVKIVGAIVAGALIVTSGIMNGISMNNAKVANENLANAMASLETLNSANGNLSQEITELNSKLAELGVSIVNLENQTAEDAIIIADYEAALAAIELAEANKTDEVVETEVVFAGYTKDELSLDYNKTIVLDNDDFEKLGDYEVEFNDEDIDVEETLSFSGAFASNDKDFNGETMYKLAEDEVVYKVAFDVDNASFVDDSFEISFLGKDIEIVSLESGSFKIKASDNVFGTVGQVIEGVEIMNIGEDSVVVKFDGEVEIINKDSSKTINDLEIEVEEIFYMDNGNSMVSLRIGEDLDEVIEVGDFYDEAENWEYTSIELTGIELTLVEDFDEDDTALKAGEVFSLPNEFVGISFELSTEEMNSVDVEYKSDNEVVFKGDFEDAEGDVYFNGTMFIDDDNEAFNTLVLKDSDYNVNFNNISGNFEVGDIEFSLDVKTLLEVNGNVETTNDDNIKSVIGIEVSAPEDDMENGELSFAVPEEVIEATIKVE